MSLPSKLAQVQWRSNDMIKSIAGVVVASDQRLEWLLPWWWAHYHKYNSHPIAFVDFGMSPEAIKWCQQRGELVELRDSFDFLIPKKDISPDLAQKWHSLFHNQDFWNIRQMCLKKPFAMLKSPFRYTLWTDLDCEIKGSIEPLFETCNDEIGFSIAPQPLFAIQNYIEKGLLQSNQITYNAGVVVFRYQSPVVFKWAQAVVEKNAYFPGDSDLLADLIRTHHIDIFELPQIYNWRMAQGANPHAVIIHWVADWGKQHIRKAMTDMHLEKF